MTPIITKVTKQLKKTVNVFNLSIRFQNLLFVRFLLLAIFTSLQN